MEAEEAVEGGSVIKKEEPGQEDKGRGGVSEGTCGGGWRVEGGGWKVEGRVVWGVGRWR